jgi:thiol-disulfide isomerase/thioredoxin
MSSRRSFLLASSSLVACSGPDAPPATAKERPVPEVFITDLAGKSTSLADVVRGRVALIDLWATWCQACRDTTARAVRLHAGLKDKGLLVIGVAEGEDAATVSKYLGSEPVPYDIYLDVPFALASAIGTTELPTLIIADKAGTIRRITNRLDADVVRLIGVLLES